MGLPSMVCEGESLGPSERAAWLAVYSFKDAQTRVI